MGRALIEADGLLMLTETRAGGDKPSVLPSHLHQLAADVTGGRCAIVARSRPRGRCAAVRCGRDGGTMRYRGALTAARAVRRGAPRT
jgi:hypothetical protein